MDERARLVLRTRGTHSALLLLVCAAFTAVGVAMLIDSAPKGWLVTSFFGLCTLIAAVNALPNASFLALDREGFEMRALFRTTRFRWSDIRTFGVATVGVQSMVVFTYTEPYRREHPAARRAFHDIEGALPDSYGHTPEQLAALLCDWQRGLRRSPTTDGSNGAKARGLALVRAVRGPFGLLVFRLLSLFAFCGGPMWRPATVCS
jgi:hypothetical protein